MLQIAVCDDNALHLRRAVKMIEDAYPAAAAEVNAFSSGSALLKTLAPEGYVPDVAVLDIRMEDVDGLSLAKELNRLAPSCQVIFLTGYSSSAPEAYLTNHVWFIPKERADEFLLPAIERAASGVAPYTQESVMTIRSQGKLLLVPVQSVLYIDRVGRKTRVVCRTEEHLVTQSPASLIPASLEPYMIRCHQGYWVNAFHITALDHNDFVLDSGTRIPISRTYRSAARSQFFHLHRGMA